MADNIDVTPGAGKTVAGDEIGGVLHQRVKIEHGADGSATDVSTASPLPVTLPAATVTTLTPPAAITGFATDANQSTQITALQLIDDAIATTGSAITTKGNAIAGTDGTNARIVKTDASGELQVDVLTLPNVTVGAALPAGNNNIGDVDVASLPALPAGNNNIGDVDIASIAAGDNNIGNVDIVTMPNVTIGAAIPAGTNNIGDVDVLTLPNVTIGARSAPSTVTMSRAAINISSSGDNTIVAAVGGQTVRIHKLFLIASGAVNLKFKDGASTDLTPALPLQAYGAMTLDFDQEPWFITAAGNALIINLSAAVQVSGRVYFTQSA